MNKVHVRYDALDAMRILAAFFVVCIHYWIVAWLNDKSVCHCRRTIRCSFFLYDYWLFLANGHR